MNEFDSECVPDEDDEDEDSELPQENNNDELWSEYSDDLALLVQNLDDSDIRKYFHESGNTTIIVFVNSDHKT